MVTTEASASSGKLGLRQRRSLTVMYNTPHYVDKDGYNTGSGSSGDGLPKLQVTARGTDSQNCRHGRCSSKWWCWPADMVVLGRNGVVVAMVVAVSTPRGGPELLVVAVCHLAANRGRDAFDAGAGPLRRWWPSGSMGLHAFELRLGLGLDLTASGRFSSALGGRPTRVPAIFWWRGGVQVAVSSASVLGGVTC